MKKALLFVLLISCIGFAKSQVITVSYNEEEVGENDTLTLKAANNNEIQFNPTFHNNEMFNIVCRVQGEKLNQTTTEITSICTVVCKDGYLSAPFVFNGNSTYSDTQIDFDVPESAEPGLFKITIFDTSNTSNNASFYVKVYNKNAGVETAVASMTLKAWPNPASSEVNVRYRLTSEKGNLRLYDMSGRLVKEAELNSQEGTVRMDVRELPKGVYMIGVSGMERGMNKIVVR